MTTSLKTQMTPSKAQLEEAIAAAQSKERQQAPIFHIDLEEAQRKAAQAFLEEETDLTEVAPEPVDVAIREYRLVDMTDNEGNALLDDVGKPRKSKKPYTRIAHIERFVPTELFFQTVALRKRYRNIADGTTEDNYEESLKFMVQQVLKVWQLTEEDMTYEQLTKGLDFPKIKELFKLFFDNMTGGKKKAHNG